MEECNQSPLTKERMLLGHPLVLFRLLLRDVQHGNPFELNGCQVRKYDDYGDLVEKSFICDGKIMVRYRQAIDILKILAQLEDFELWKNKVTWISKSVSFRIWKILCNSTERYETPNGGGPDDFCITEWMGSECEELIDQLRQLLVIASNLIETEEIEKKTQKYIKEKTILFCISTGVGASGWTIDRLETNMSIAQRIAEESDDLIVSALRKAWTMSWE